MAPSRRLACAAIAATLAASVPLFGARAAPLSMAELTYDNALLNGFNLVTLGNLNYTNGFDDIGGRAIVGGNVTMAAFSGGGVCQTACPGNTTQAIDSTKMTYGALTVFGSVIGTNNNGNWVGGTAPSGTSAYVGGNASNTTYWGNSNTTLKIAGSTTNVSAPFGGVVAAVFPFTAGIAPIATEVNNLSQKLRGLANLPGTPGATAEKLVSNGTSMFTTKNDYTVNGFTYGVVTATVADLANGKFRGVQNGSGNNSTIVVVTGDGAGLTLPSIASFTGSDKVLYDFVDARSLTFGGNWAGSILAPLATITTGTTGLIDGSVIVNSINLSTSLGSGYLFSGDLRGFVPEPASMALLAVGAAGAAWVARRRRV